MKKYPGWFVENQQRGKKLRVDSEKNLKTGDYMGKKMVILERFSFRRRLSAMVANCFGIDSRKA